MESAVYVTEELAFNGRIDRWSSFKEAKEFVEKQKEETGSDFIVIKEVTVWSTQTLDELLKEEA